MPVTRQRRAVYALGSARDDRLEALQGALDALVDPPGVTCAGVSPVYEASPAAGPPRAGVLSAVLVIDTVLASSVLLERARGVEEAMHRRRGLAGGQRIIDVELVTVGDEISHGPVLRLPHPRAHERARVLLPWCDVDPTGWLPGRGAVADLVGTAPRANLARREDLPLRPPA